MGLVSGGKAHCSGSSPLTFPEASGALGLVWSPGVHKESPDVGLLVPEFQHTLSLNAAATARKTRGQGAREGREAWAWAELAQGFTSGYAVCLDRALEIRVHRRVDAQGSGVKSKTGTDDPTASCPSPGPSALPHLCNRALSCALWVCGGGPCCDLGPALAGSLLSSSSQMEAHLASAGSLPLPQPPSQALRSCRVPGQHSAQAPAACSAAFSLQAAWGTCWEAAPDPFPAPEWIGPPGPSTPAHPRTGSTCSGGSD